MLMTAAELKMKTTITRQDIIDLLVSIGKPGEKRDEKIEAVKSLGRTNRQGYGLESSLESYEQY